MFQSLQNYDTKILQHMHVAIAYMFKEKQRFVLSWLPKYWTPRRSKTLKKKKEWIPLRISKDISKLNGGKFGKIA